MIVSRNGRISMGVAAAVIATLVMAGVAMRAAGQSANPDEVLSLQKKFQDSVVAGDVKTVGAMMADESFFIHGNGAMQGKAEFLAAIANAPFSGYELKDPKVVFFDGGAIVSGLVDITFRPRQGATTPPVVIHMRGSSVWVKSAAGWRLLLDQDTTLQAPPPAPAPH